MNTTIQIINPETDEVECTFEKDDLIVYFIGKHDGKWCAKFLDKEKDRVLLECITIRVKSYFEDHGTGTLFYIPEKFEIGNSEKEAL